MAVTSNVQPANSTWWVPLLGGVAAVVVGLMLLTAPAATMLVAVQLLGLFWLIDGLFTVVSLFIDRTNWLWKAISGVVGILAGLFIVQHPLWSSLLVPATYVGIMGAIGVILGVAELINGLRGGGWGVAILGVMSVLLGLVLLFNPVVAALGFTLVLGVMTVVGGVGSIVTAFRSR